MTTLFSFYLISALTISTNIFLNIPPGQSLILSKDPCFTYAGILAPTAQSVLSVISVIICFFLSIARSVTKVSHMFLQILKELQILLSSTVKREALGIFFKLLVFKYLSKQLRVAHE